MSQSFQRHLKAAPARVYEALTTQRWLAEPYELSELVTNARVVMTTSSTSIVFVLIDDLGGTRLGVVQRDLPRGVRPEDNQRAWAERLKKLAAFCER